jgi:predicted amidohydrolase YtcJ
MVMPDLILTHARVHTFHTHAALAEAVAVKDGRIVAVGSHDDVLNLQQAETHVIDLNGATLLPGFHDAHCHVLNFGLTLDMVSLASPPVHTVGDIVLRLAERAVQTHAGPETWVRGRGYDQNKLAERRHPTRQDLDAVPGDPCIVITHASGHAAAVNSRVLRLAGITRDTPDPAGGTIVRDDLGEPTGVLLENAMLLAYAIAPLPSQPEKITALGRASQALHRMGITSAADASTSVNDLAAYRGAVEEGLLTTRCTLMLLIEQLVSDDHFLSPQDLRTPSDGDWITVGPAKLFSDGALTTRTALLRAPYVDDADQHGTAMWDTARLETLVRQAHKSGWQIAIHAIGDGAIDLCLDAIGKAQAHHPRPNARHRIEHAMLLWRDQIGRMARLGILPVFQPEFISQFGDAYLTAVGRARAERIMPYQAAVQAGLPLIFSSDLPIVPGAPLDGVAAAAQRRTPSGEVLDASQSVGVREALQAYTSGAAYSVFAEHDRGRIMPGQRADFVVLDNDPMRLPLNEWADGLSVVATLVGGRVVCGGV